jgi:hypothetical protein
VVGEPLVGNESGIRRPFSHLAPPAFRARELVSMFSSELDPFRLSREDEAPRTRAVEDGFGLGSGDGLSLPAGELDGVGVRRGEGRGNS